jgi:hypothetical protein
MRNYGAVLYDLEKDISETTDLIFSKTAIADSI